MSVLAAIDTALQFSSGADYEGAAEDHAALLAARDAVAELLEADVHLDEMVARRNKFPCPGMDEHVKKARARRSAALARARGAA